MSSSGASRGWSARKQPVESIDLTKSSPSPSPEPQPRRRAPSVPRRQPAHVKPGPSPLVYRHHQTTPHAPKGKRPLDTPRQPLSRPSDPHVHPDDLARIIDTSDPHALRRVVLDLCSLSPALSCAVARGLARNSTFAQATIKTYASAVIKGEPARTRASSTESDAPELLPTPEIPSSRRRNVSPAPSNSSSSTAFSEHEPLSQPASAPTTPLEGLPSKFPVQHVPLSRSASASRNRKMLCEKCQRAFDRETQGEGCLFHSGRQVMNNRRLGWDCCGAQPLEAGCAFQDAHTVPHAQDIPKKRTPSHEFLSPVRNQKTPRLF